VNFFAFDAAVELWSHPVDIIKSRTIRPAQVSIQRLNLPCFLIQQGKSVKKVRFQTRSF